MNELEIGVIVFLVLMTVAGIFIGLIRCVFGMAAFVLSAAVSFVVTRLFSIAVNKGSAADAVCFIVVFAVAYIAMLVVLLSLNLLANHPVLSTLNKVGGAVLGGVLGLMCVWIFMAVLTVLVQNGTGVELMKMIESSALLTGLYENNIIDILFQEHLWNKIELD